MNSMWLVQRCSIAKPFIDTMRVGEYLNLDYMGSSEFEWGAFPKTLRALNEKYKNLQIYEIKTSKKSIWLLCTGMEYEFYSNEILEYVKKGKHLKEYISLGDHLSGNRPEWHKDTIWVDVGETNNVVFSLEKEQVENFYKAIPNSIKYMDEQKSKNE
jgi:hypothetical protein